MADPDVPAWVVTGQNETVDTGPDGSFVPGVRVSFRTAAGVTGAVFVPLAGYTAENVKASINARASVISEVGSLTG